MNLISSRARRWALALLVGLMLLPSPAQAQVDTTDSLKDIAGDFAAGEIIIALNPQLAGADSSTNPSADVVAASGEALTIGAQQFTVLASLDMRRAPVADSSGSTANGSTANGSTANGSTANGSMVNGSTANAAAVDVNAAGLDERTLSGWVVRVEPGAELATVEALRREPAVAFAEPNWIVRAADEISRPQGPDLPLVEQSNGTLPVPNADLIAMMPVAEAESPFFVSDPFYAEDQWDMQRINASRAWQLIERLAAGEGAGESTGAEPIRIAIVDSGIDAFHGDLYGRVLDGKNYLEPLEAPKDDYGHGTHVAGSAGATLNNGIGIAGVANEVLLDPRKVLDGNGAGRISNLAQAIRDAADDGANIINLSLETGEESQTLSRALEYAAGQGALLIAASGNGGRDVKWPAVHPDVMAVAALDYTDQRAYYSNYGDEIEIAAPGGTFSSQPIYSTWSRDAKYINPVTGRETNKCDTGLREVNSSSYCARTGTSMAAGIVSGVAAAVWAQQPELTADELRNLLRTTAAPLDADAIYVGSGRIDFFAALRQAVPSELTLSSETLNYRLAESTVPFTTTVELANISAQPLIWRATLSVDPTGDVAVDGEAPAAAETDAITDAEAEAKTEPTTDDWIMASTPLAGSIAYGRPARVSLRVMPALLRESTVRTHRARLTVTGTRADGTTIMREAQIALTLNATPLQTTATVFLPLVNSSEANAVEDDPPVEPIGASAGDIEYRWEEPGDAERINRVLTDDSSLYVNLPFAFEMRGRSYTSARLYSDGLLAFPADDDVEGPPRCLPNVEWPRQAVYGWWADLNPGAAGARVSSFQPDADRYVIEFLNVPDVAGTYRVSFQMVLNRGGSIVLNYGALDGTSDPDALIASADNSVDGINRAAVVIGVEAADGRFHNLVSCASSALELGRLPRPYQSITFSTADIY